MTTPQTLCLVEDDPIMGESLCYRFELEGFRCDWFKTALAAQSHIGTEDYAALISDIRLPDMSGTELFEQLLKEGRTLPPTIFITGFGSIGDAVELLKKGAADYITKPFDLDILMEKVRAICREQIPQGEERAPVLGISATMRTLEQTLCRVSGHDATVLITGESGVGKEHAARFLHRCAFGESDRPFVAVNCGAIPEGLMESELFGSEKGAFTGAVRTRRGVFEQANGGTLFLDEIGDMPPNMQVRLLRVIQERQVVRVGGETPIPLDLRLICATHRDLKQMVSEGTFREDLYYRINVVHVHIPPLRERREDILWFTRLFLNEIDPDNERHLLPSAEQQLLQHDWPGNLRELHHSIERATILTPEPGIGASAFAGDVVDDESDSSTDLRDRLSRYEHQLITEALRRHDFQINETANELGISRKNLWEKMKKLGIERD
ncbi:MAG: sigma-54 dependent transcriptional regulator [Gammaproteobacteria bacterium]|nr:sigma-54 dependent transcriptional regulator [Gammaproteobacteria bacterium]MCW8841095.1 sigma-54 dependent transcriptional regulator [Gammaproteobacteria bacterium]MCW8928186.1 sigma-54 dependent transcriptional regulator [Gammaproteobacteria bacterium]MCW8958547.1 sigma-54 dependent transcriptional regulator [Gammaproteobacteria bacterium]MCW8972422.1 sigma-54 dependent transcriptional regulator [Gammaproteobacteria bacterium]